MLNWVERWEKKNVSYGITVGRGTRLDEEPTTGAQPEGTMRRILAGAGRRGALRSQWGPRKAGRTVLHSKVAHLGGDKYIPG